MSYRWIVLFIVLVCVAIFSTVVAQNAPTPPPTVEVASEEPAAIELPVLAAPPAPAAPPATAAAPAVPADPGAAAPAATPASPILPGDPVPPATATAPPALPAVPGSAAPTTAPLPPAAIPPPSAPPVTTPPATRSRSINSNGGANTQARRDSILVAGDLQLLVIQLRNTEAGPISEMLRNLLDVNEFEATRPTVDARSNALVLRGRQEDVERVRKLVEQLDNDPAALKLSGRNTFQQLPALNRRSTQPSPAHQPPLVNSPWVANRSISAADSKLVQEYSMLESQSLEIAKRYRKAAETLGNNHPQQKGLRDEIAGLVEKAFDVRQSLQSQELKQLQERVHKVEQSLAKRSQNRSEIVAKRVKELLEEDRELEWNASNGPANSPNHPAVFGSQATGTAQPGNAPNAPIFELPIISPTSANASPTPTAPVIVGPTPELPVGPILPTPVLGLPPANTPKAVPLPTRPATGSAPTSVDPFAQSKGSTSPDSASSDPFGAPAAPAKDPFAPETIRPSSTDPFSSPPNTDPHAQPPGAEQRRNVRSAQEALLRKEADVAAWKNRLKESELQSNDQYQAAVRELEFAKRQMESAKRESETLLKLLELDLQAAKTDQEAAQRKLEANKAVRAKSRSGVSDETLSELGYAVRQAEVRVQRAQTLFDHHRAAVDVNQSTTPQAGIVPQKQSDPFQ